MARFNHELLRNVRLDLGLTQEQAASAIGVDVRTYRRYECGDVNRGGDFSVRHAARRRLLRRMCEEFGVATEAEWLAASPAEGNRRAAEAPRGEGPPGGGAAAPPAAPSSVARGSGPGPGAGAPASAGADGRAVERWGACFAHPLQPARHSVGRERLLAWLEAWHGGDSGPRVAAVVGVGGSGKTALVERFLRGAVGAGGAGGVFVWSFYEDARVEALLAGALAYFANESAGGEGGRLERLVATLRRGPRHLLVFDGLEEVQSGGGGGRALGEIEEPGLRRLVCAIAAGLGGARLLLTSRLRPADLEAWEGANVATLSPGDLARDEATALLRAWGLGGDDGALDALAGRAGGHALSVAVLGSYGEAFLGGDARRAGALVLREAARDDAKARRLAGVLDAYAAALEPLECDALARLSVFGAAVEIDHLAELASAGGLVAGALAGAGEAAIARALGRLERLGLVFRAGERPARFAAHPFVREFFKALVDAPPEHVHEALRGALAARLGGRPGGRAEGPGELDELEALFVHTLEAGRAAEAWGVYERRLGGFGSLGLRLGAMGRGARLLRRFSREGAPERLRPNVPPTLGAEIAYDWGLYAGALGDLELACRCYEAHGLALEAPGGDGAPRATLGAMGRRTLAYTLRLRGDLGRAADLLGESLAVARRAGSSFHLARGLALLAAIEHERGRPEAALRCLEGAREHDPAPVARRAFWQAELRLGLGQAREAEALAREGLDYCVRRGWPGHVAHGHVLLGESAVGADLAAAGAHLERARPWALESGEVEMALRCHQLAARIKLARGDFAGALRHAALGLEPAEVYGFRPFAARLRVLAAEAELRRGAFERAESWARAAAALAEACDLAWARADATHALGAALAGRGRADAARASLRAAFDLRARLAHPGAGETRAVLQRLGGG